MRQTLTAGIVAGSLVLSTLVALPSAQAQTTTGTDTSPVISDEAAKALQDLSTQMDALSQEGGSAEGSQSSDADPSDPRIPALDPNPNDPLKFPEDNPLDKISSSELFLDWTKDMEEGDGKEFVQAWARNSSIPDTANPIELWKMEAQGSAQMSSGLFTGDFPLSSGGSSQATSVLFTVMFAGLIFGSVIELIMRGLRMAGVIG